MSLAFASFTNFFTENVWELVTAHLESLPTRQNGVENRDKAYCMSQASKINIDEKQDQ